MCKRLATVVAATVTGNFVRLMQVNPSVSNSAGRREHGNTADLLRSNNTVVTAPVSDSARAAPSNFCNMNGRLAIFD